MIHPPNRPHLPPLPDTVVCRERLLRQLDASRELRLTLLCAPAGYGKTTLVADWLRNSKATFAWLTLEARDDQGGVFWPRVGRALQAAGVRLNPAHGSHPFLDERDDTPLLPRLLDALAAYARQWHAPHALMLVLDDFHVLQDSELLDGINRFLDQCPPLLHCIVTSRHEPELRLSRRRVANELLEIRHTDLRFSTSAWGCNCSRPNCASCRTRPKAGLPPCNWPAARCNGSRT
jgi:LuxR family maltose regulon positive regulatory protein